MAGLEFASKATKRRVKRERRFAKTFKRKGGLRVTGEKEILRNLNKAIEGINGDIEGGLLAAAKFVQGEAQQTTPWEFSVLVNSAFSGVGRIGKRIIARIGYTARYAPFVHEMPETNNFSKPGTGPKFLENAVVKNTKVILEIIKKRAKR